MLTLDWMKCEGDVWCSFLDVDLSSNHFNNLSGVYIVFYLGAPGKVVRVGQGNIADRIAKHRQDKAITAYKNLLVTWAKVAANQQDGVEKYLADTFDPLVGERFPDRAPTPVNSPFS